MHAYGFVWSLSVIESDMKVVSLEKDSHLYPYQRRISWTGKPSFLD
jgi:hypothetical protein